MYYACVQSGRCFLVQGPDREVLVSTGPATPELAKEILRSYLRVRTRSQKVFKTEVDWTLCQTPAFFRMVLVNIARPTYPSGFRGWRLSVERITEFLSLLRQERDGHDVSWGAFQRDLISQAGLPAGWV